MRWGEERGFDIDWLEDLSQMSPNRLRNYNTVVLLNNNTRLWMTRVPDRPESN